MESKRLVTSAENALDSLERLAAELEKGSSNDPMALKGTLSWGWHAVALLSYMRMQPHRDRFDAWIWDYLDEGSPELQLERDAHWQERQRLSLLEILDIFSEVEMPLLKPEFYQGWTDRTVRCQTLRRQISEIIGGGIGADQREGLLTLLAAYHRLLRFPAAIEIDVDQVKQEVPELLDFIETLIDTTESPGTEMNRVLGRCREAVQHWSGDN